MAVTGKALELALAVIRNLPPGVFFDTSNDVHEPMLSFQGREAMQYFPGIVWRKTYNKECRWWEYDAELPDSGGLRLHIYADGKGPASCKKVEYEEEVEIEVPVETRKEKRIVKRYRWECPPEPNVIDGDAIGKESVNANTGTDNGGA